MFFLSYSAPVHLVSIIAVKHFFRRFFSWVVDIFRYERMYLHVDADSAEATGLYSSMGYEMIEQFKPPRWVKKLLGLRNIRYQVKHLDGKKGPVL